MVLLPPNQRRSNICSLQEIYFKYREIKWKYKDAIPTIFIRKLFIFLNIKVDLKTSYTNKEGQNKDKCNVIKRYG